MLRRVRLLLTPRVHGGRGGRRDDRRRARGRGCSRRIAGVCDARGVDDVLFIAVIGLTIALAVALVGIRRRTDELDELRRDVARKNQTRAGAEAARTAAATRESVESLEAVLPVGVLHFGQDRRIERANERAYALLDAKPGRLIGRTVMEAFLDPRAEGMISGVPIGGSATGEVKVGDREPHVLVIRVHRPDAAGVLVVIEDASELRRLQQIRSEFIDNLSHELRTPLSTVSLLAETLARDAERRRPGADAGADHEDRGRDRPPRPDGQRAARPRPDRGRQPARARRRRRPRRTR